jgi:hypothetical protein
MVSTPILVLWWTTLIAAIVLVLPIAYYLLDRTFRAARHVRDYTGEILAAAEGIERNMAAASELERLPEATSRIRRVIAGLAADAGDMETSLRG